MGRAAILAAVLLAVLTAARFALEGDAVPRPGMVSQMPYGGFHTGRKNYASEKQLAGAIAAADAQKHEKVATVGLSTSRFDEDRARIDALVTASAGITQFENQIGLDGARVLQLGIGVPPARFDAFIADARRIARLTDLAVIKTDRPTNTGSCARGARPSRRPARPSPSWRPGGSNDERLKVQAQ